MMEIDWTAGSHLTGSYRLRWYFAGCTVVIEILEVVVAETSDCADEIVFEIEVVVVIVIVVFGVWVIVMHPDVDGLVTRPASILLQSGSMIRIVRGLDRAYSHTHAHGQIQISTTQVHQCHYYCMSPMCYSPDDSSLLTVRDFAMHYDCCCC